MNPDPLPVREILFRRFLNQGTELMSAVRLGSLDTTYRPGVNGYIDNTLGIQSLGITGEDKGVVGRYTAAKTRKEGFTHLLVALGMAKNGQVARGEKSTVNKVVKREIMRVEGEMRVSAKTANPIPSALKILPQSLSSMHWLGITRMEVGVLA
ncbi:MAG: hypothetical protein Q9180_001691 [Flavoplaca navasiana]